MDQHLARELRAVFYEQARRYAGESELYEWICTDLADGLNRDFEPIGDMLSQFMQTLSLARPPRQLPFLLLSGIHWLVLGGLAPAVAPYFPSAGGAYSPAGRPAFTAVVRQLIATRRDDILHFMLSQPIRTSEVGRCAGLLPGYLAAARRFPGGLFLLELGADTGLNLFWDQYTYIYRTAAGHLPWLPANGGHDGRDVPECSFECDVVSGPGQPAAAAPMLADILAMQPRVTGRFGIHPEPLDITREEHIQLLAAFARPEQTAKLARLRQAAAIFKAGTRRAGIAPGFEVKLVTGNLAGTLPALLTEVYAAMAPGNTLLIYSAGALTQLSEWDYGRIVQAIQILSANLEGGKPLAWLQLEQRRGGAGTVWPELRLATFGDQNSEDRQEILLAGVDWPAQHMVWHGRDVSARW